MAKKASNNNDEIQLLSVDGVSEEVEVKPKKESKLTKKIDNEILSIDDNRQDDKKKSINKWIIRVLIILVLVFIIIIGKTINENKDVTKGKSYPRDNVSTSKKGKDVHYVTCTNEKANFHGFSYYFRLEYVDNELSNYSYNYIIDKGELSEDEIWRYVQNYKDDMKFEPDVTGYSADDLSNPYLYHVYYELSADNYCKQIGECSDKERRFDLVDEMVPDFEKSLGVTCVVK